MVRLMVNPVRSGTRSECAACGEVFNGVPAFDEHRTGPVGQRHCLGADQLSANFTRDARGYWTESRALLPTLADQRYPRDGSLKVIAEYAAWFMNTKTPARNSSKPWIS